MSSHIHVPEDRRGPRKVFVDGAEVKGAYYADTLKGVVEYYVQPPKVDPKKPDQILSRTVRGSVKVKMTGNANQEAHPAL